MITFEQIRAVGGIVHSDGNIFFRDISMLQGLAGAAPVAVTPHGDYPQLPKHVTAYYDDVDHMEVRCFSESQMHAYFDLGRQAAPALEAPSAYNSAGPIKRYMLDCNIDGMDQFREFILATDHDTLVHDVLANADPAGTVQENGLLRDQVRQLDAMVGRMKREAAAPQAPEQ